MSAIETITQRNYLFQSSISGSPLCHCAHTYRTSLNLYNNGHVIHIFIWPSEVSLSPLPLCIAVSIDSIPTDSGHSSEPPTVIALDGTWAQARSLLSGNEFLQKLKKVDIETCVTTCVTMFLVDTCTIETSPCSNNSVYVLRYSLCIACFAVYTLSSA